MMPPGNDRPAATRQKTGQRGRWYKLIRCSICTSLIWFYPVMLKEPVEAPEPRREWVLCKPCHKALLVEMRRSTIRSPLRLRIAMGFVAAERSPQARTMSTANREQEDFERELAWAFRLMILVALMHVVLFAIILVVPK